MFIPICTLEKKWFPKNNIRLFNNDQRFKIHNPKLVFSLMHLYRKSYSVIFSKAYRVFVVNRDMNAGFIVSFFMAYTMKVSGIATCSF